MPTTYSYALRVVYGRRESCLSLLETTWLPDKGAATSRMVFQTWVRSDLLKADLDATLLLWAQLAWTAAETEWRRLDGGAPDSPEGGATPSRGSRG